LGSVMFGFRGKESVVGCEDGFRSVDDFADFLLCSKFYAEIQLLHLVGHFLAALHQKSPQQRPQFLVSGGFEQAVPKIELHLWLEIDDLVIQSFAASQYPSHEIRVHGDGSDLFAILQLNKCRAEDCCLVGEEV